MSIVGEFLLYYIQTRIKVQVQDVSGIDNYYRIKAFVKYRISQVYLDPGEFDPVGPQFLRRGTIRVELDNKAEPILYGGSHTGANWDYAPDEKDYYANEYNLFNDNASRRFLILTIWTETTASRARRWVLSISMCAAVALFVVISVHLCSS